MQVPSLNILLEQEFCFASMEHGVLARHTSDVILSVFMYSDELLMLVDFWLN